MLFGLFDAGGLLTVEPGSYVVLLSEGILGVVVFAIIFTMPSLKGIRDRTEPAKKQLKPGRYPAFTLMRASGIDTLLRVGDFACLIGAMCILFSAFRMNSAAH